jgi:hypothetical protein
MDHMWQRYLAGGLLGAALVLAVLASAAVGRIVVSDPAVTAAGGAAQAPGSVATGGAQYRLSPPNEAQSDGPAAVTTDVAAGNATAFCPGDCQLGLGGRVPYRLSAPNETDSGDGPGFATYREDHRSVGVVNPAAGRQQAELYATEVRDNGVTTAANDSGPCREPGRSCDR